MHSSCVWTHESLLICIPVFVAVFINHFTIIFQTGSPFDPRISNLTRQGPGILLSPPPLHWICRWMNLGSRDHTRAIIHIWQELYQLSLSAISTSQHDSQTQGTRSVDSAGASGPVPWRFWTILSIRGWLFPPLFPTRLWIKWNTEMSLFVTFLSSPFFVIMPSTPFFPFSLLFSFFQLDVDTGPGVERIVKCSVDFHKSIWQRMNYKS